MSIVSTIKKFLDGFRQRPPGSGSPNPIPKPKPPPPLKCNVCNIHASSTSTMRVDFSKEKRLYSIIKYFCPRCNKPIDIPEDKDKLYTWEDYEKD